MLRDRKQSMTLVNLSAQLSACFVRLIQAMCIALVLPCAVQAETSSRSESTKPNIVLIFADDLGWKDVGYQGTDFYETPNIDKLTSQGVVFTQAYAGAGNCAPSRACLLSGQYTPRHGVYAVDSTKRGPEKEMRLEPISNKSGLGSKVVTMAEALKAAGYTTAMFGKWHLSGPDGASPGEQGFDVARATAAGGNKYDDSEAEPSEPRAGKKNAKSKGGRGDDPKQIFSITREACEFMEASKDRPFFAFVSHHAIHTPLQARPETLARFKAKKPGAQHNDALYAACTYDFDESVGILLKKLADLGLEDNTLVVFTSDNGATPDSSQEPLRGNKGCYYDGGIREPFIIRWPGKAKPGSKSDVPIINVDLYPTFLAAAGAKPPDDQPLDGENLISLLNPGGKLQRKAIFWHFPGYLNRPVARGRDPLFRSRPVSVIRKGEWKLHLYHEEWLLNGGRDALASNHAVELYNLSTDPGEHRDISVSETSKRDELLGDLLNWVQATNAPLARVRP